MKKRFQLLILYYLFTKLRYFSRGIQQLIPILWRGMSGLLSVLKKSGVLTILPESVAITLDLWLVVLDKILIFGLTIILRFDIRRYRDSLMTSRRAMSLQLL